MRHRRLLNFAAAGLVSACASAQVQAEPDNMLGTEIPLDAGTVPLEASADGITLLLYGTLRQERFNLDSVRAVGSRLASRSPDPDLFRIVRYDTAGGVLDTIHLWSPLDRFEWDAEGQRERRVSVDEARVVIPVPAHLGVSAVELAWPGEPGLGRIDVHAALRRFCAMSPQNPGCRL